VFGEGNDEIAGGDNEGVVVQVVDDEWAKEECRFWWERTDLSET
jgi:acetylcholinesterase